MVIRRRFFHKHPFNIHLAINSQVAHSMLLETLSCCPQHVVGDLGVVTHSMLLETLALGVMHVTYEVPGGVCNESNRTCTQVTTFCEADGTKNGWDCPEWTMFPPMGAVWLIQGKSPW
eukprot:g50047.t1